MTLKIIGTSHIARQSVKEIEKAILEFDPDIIAIELDKGRMAGLLAKERPKPTWKDIRKIGLKGYLFLLLGAWAEKKLGDSVGMKPGADMLAAATLAKEKGKQLAFIDQEIQVTLSRLSRAISWKERWHFVADLFKGVVLRRQEIVFDLSTVPDDATIEAMISKVRERYPNIYRVLVEERNQYMAGQLRRITRLMPEKKILAIVGAGHKEGMLVLLGADPEVSYSFSLGNKGLSVVV